MLTECQATLLTVNVDLSRYNAGVFYFEIPTADVDSEAL